MKPLKKDNGTRPDLVPNEFWSLYSWRGHGYTVDKSKATQGILRVDDQNCLGHIVKAARGAGIPESQWHEIKKENDYDGCYYEGDVPDIMWIFPLSVFDRHHNEI